MLKLISKEGCFELWSDKKFHAEIIVATGDERSRVSITLATWAGNHAHINALRAFNKTTQVWNTEMKR